jgi:hypothetical protein
MITQFEEHIPCIGEVLTSNLKQTKRILFQKYLIKIKPKEKLTKYDKLKKLRSFKKTEVECFDFVELQIEQKPYEIVRKLPIDHFEEAPKERPLRRVKSNIETVKQLALKETNTNYMVETNIAIKKEQEETFAYESYELIYSPNLCRTRIFLPERREISFFFIKRESTEDDSQLALRHRKSLKSYLTYGH